MTEPIAREILRLRLIEETQDYGDPLLHAVCSAGRLYEVPFADRLKIAMMLRRFAETIEATTPYGLLYSEEEWERSHAWKEKAE